MKLLENAGIDVCPSNDNFDDVLAARKTTSYHTQSENPLFEYILGNASAATKHPLAHHAGEGGSGRGEGGSVLGSKAEHSQMTAPYSSEGGIKVVTAALSRPSPFEGGIKIVTAAGMPPPLEEMQPPQIINNMRVITAAASKGESLSVISATANAPDSAAAPTKENGSEDTVPVNASKKYLEEMHEQSGGGEEIELGKEEKGDSHASNSSAPAPATASVSDKDAAVATVLAQPQLQSAEESDGGEEVEMGDVKESDRDVNQENDDEIVSASVSAAAPIAAKGNTSDKNKDKNSCKSSQEIAHKLVGSVRICKLFPRYGYFNGLITSFDSESGLFTICYDDGDKEELTPAKLKPLLPKKYAYLFATLK